MRKSKRKIGKGWHKVKMYGDFRDKMKLTDESIRFAKENNECFKRLEYFPWMHKGIQFDTFYLSIQASYGHYCIPRMNLKTLKEYFGMEIAFVNNSGGWTSINEILSNDLYERLNNYFGDCVYSYVPVKLIHEIYEYCFKNH